MSYTPRNNVRSAIARDSHSTLKPAPCEPTEIYGRDVFNMKAMRERLPKAVFKRIEQAVCRGSGLAEGDADIVANAMRDWAIERGATHYTHWFHPMTGVTAEKHDAFITPDIRYASFGALNNEFSGKMLIKGEPDASSFPSGGIRSTFEARGYTAWDPTSPAFLIENAYGKTLYIPTFFISYTGEALDRKTPLLRSLDAVGKQALRILRLFGNETAFNVNAMVGAEQEYFLVDRRYAALRDDLQLAGRAVFGAAPDKGQELEDHYFGAISSRILNYMADVENKLFALGIPAKTRHNEVAPAQYELAPLYEAANVATDHNMLVMEVLRNVAEKHGFACLLHEKPFAGINGSGKHNNWSLADSDGQNLLEPGETPHDNAQFLVFLAAVLKAVHEHPGVLRLGTVGSGNDHRLGANEAPPAILSIFLGDQLTEIIEGLANGTNGDEGRSAARKSTLEIGVSTMPNLPKDVSDRNRTSPFAFTGNKFEFRAVGSSQSIAPANIAINCAMANALDDIATELEAAINSGKNLEKAVQELLAKLFKKHLPVVFNGNGYSKEWEEEAARRGLPNYKDTVTAIVHYSDKKVMDAFMRHGVLSERELLARQEILFEQFIKEIDVEAKVASSIARTQILPVALNWLHKVGSTAAMSKALLGENSPCPELEIYREIHGHVHGLKQALDKLESCYLRVEEIEDVQERAIATRDQLRPLIDECREHVDALEKLVDDDLWPLPKFNEMLWQQ